MANRFTAYIERDAESGQYISIVPGVRGAHTQASTIDKLIEQTKEVLELCLEEMDDEERDAIPFFVGVQQIEVAI